jgi:hypothetical protein
MLADVQCATCDLYLRVLKIRYMYCAQHHPQTIGEIERFHETLKARMKPAGQHQLW